MPTEVLMYEINMMLAGEEWRTICDGMYRVSNFGRVYSLFTNTYLAQTDNGVGYLKVSIKENGKDTMKYVHRLVAEAFIPNPMRYPVVDHISTDRGDNRACNLRWVTQHANCNNPLSVDKRQINLYTITFNDGEVKKFTAKELIEYMGVGNARSLYNYRVRGFPKRYNIACCKLEKITIADSKNRA